MERIAPIITISLYPVVCFIIFSILVKTGDGMMLDRSSSVEDYGYNIPVGDFILTDRKTKHRRLFHDNGMLYLVLHELAEKFLKELQEEERLYLDVRQQDLIREKIRGFYHRIVEHPALRNDRVIFPPNKEEFMRMLPPPSTDLSFTDEKMTKRGGPLEESCQSQSGWVSYRYGDTQDYMRLQLVRETFFM